VANDQWLRLCTAEKARGQIQGARLFSFEHELAHYAVFRAPNILRDCVLPFLREIGMQP
jgi:hypothetical protein